MTLYLDTSVLIPYFCSEKRSELVAHWFKSFRGQYLISDLVLAEFSSAASRKVRERLLSDDEASACNTAFDTWRQDRSELILIKSADLATARLLVQTPRPRLLVPDAIHLAICRRLGLTLVTFDEDLFTVAAREGVEAILPS